MAAGRHFHVDAGAGNEASSTTNWQLVFDDAYMEAQAAALSPRLIAEGHEEATPEAVAAAIRNDRCGPRWLSGALQRVTLEMPGRTGRTQQMPGSFAIGMEPQRVKAAVHEHWELDEQGLAAVRTQLTSGGRRRRRG